jgi:phosphotransferase system HPr (HPr) family protein
VSPSSAECACATVEITNKRGLHARASAKFVNLVATLPDSLRITVAKEGAEAEGGSILGLMMLGAARGDSRRAGARAFRRRLKFVPPFDKLRVSGLCLFAQPRSG